MPCSLPAERLFRILEPSQTVLKANEGAATVT
jgi:hypothetical protein